MYNQSELLKALKKQHNALEAELAKVNKAIHALEPVEMHMMRWKDKAIECLNDFSHYCQTVDILECVYENNKEILDNEVTRKRHITALSVALLDMVKTGQLVMFKVRKTKGSFYGFPEWFEKDGSLKKKYLCKKLKKLNGSLSGLLITNKEAA